MQYTVKSYNVCRVPLSSRRLDTKGTFNTSSPLEAVSLAAKAAPGSFLASITDNGNPKAIRGLDVIHESPKGVAIEVDGDAIILVYPTAQGERELFKEVALWETQFEDLD